MSREAWQGLGQQGTPRYPFYTLSLGIGPELRPRSLYCCLLSLGSGIKLLLELHDSILHNTTS